MRLFNITKKNQNLEILTKVMNSVAIKYNCGVKFDSASNNICYSGDTTCKSLIVQETMGILNNKCQQG